MAMGRTFQESFQKALRGLEVGALRPREVEADREDLEHELASRPAAHLVRRPGVPRGLQQEQVST